LGKKKTVIGVVSVLGLRHKYLFDQGRKTSGSRGRGRM